MPDIFFVAAVVMTIHHFRRKIEYSAKYDNEHDPGGEAMKIEGRRVLARVRLSIIKMTYLERRQMNRNPKWTE
jgi:hypothetical protein